MHSSGRQKMLPFLTLLCIAGLCHGKAFLEESQKPRGKRLYDHGQATEKHGQFYASQNNEEPWKREGLYYYPKVDGQPIYVPAIAQSAGHMSEVLDNYYRPKTFPQTWTLATPVPHRYNTEDSYYEDFVTSNSMVQTILDETEDVHRGDFHVLPATKQSFLKYKEHTKSYGTKNEVSHDNYAPEVVNRINLKHGDKSYEAAEKPEVKYADGNSKEPIVHESLKQDTGVKYKLKGSNIQSTKSELEYEQPIVREVKRKFDTDSKSGKTKSELEYSSEYEEPVVREVKRKFDADIKYGDTKSEVESVDGYDNPVVIKRNKQVVKPKQKLVKITTPAYEDYETTHAIRKKSKGKRKKQPCTPKSYENDEYSKSTTIKNILDLKTGDEIFESDPNYKTNDLEDGNYQKVAIRSVSKEYPDETKNEIKSESQEYSAKYKEKDEIKSEPELEEHIVETEEKVEIESEPEEHLVQHKEEVEEKFEHKNHPVKSKDKVKSKNHPVKSKDKVKSKNHPVKTKEKIVIKSEEHAVKTQDKIKSGLEEHPKKEKDAIKAEYDEHPVKTKENGEIEPEKHTIKTEKVIKPEEHTVKTEEKVAIKSEKKEHPVKMKEKTEINAESEDYEDEYPEYDIEDKNKFDTDTNAPIDVETDFEDFTEEEIHGRQLEKELGKNPDEPFNLVENEDEILENTGSGILTDSQNSMNIPKFFPNMEAIQSLSSLNSNLWSLIFNPNAESLKLKKCTTRSNETGYCTYIQHCQVPNIANSLEELLNNACVIDDIFIGVCCPEFPVETVKVHWEQTPSNTDKRIDEEFVANPEDCGMRSNEAFKLQSWPWKAPLVSMSNGKIFCGGVVISEEYILTAAHCTTKIPKNQILVRLGQYDDSSGDDFAVVEIKRHAKYNSRTMRNDIALLKLGRRIVHDPHTGVVCLPNGDDEIDDKDDHEGEKATLLGWRGMFGTKSKDPEFLEIMSSEECEKKLGMKVSRSLLCTEARNESERTCNADSGAPLVIEHNGKYEVIGILSWNRNDCDRRFPSTFSRVSTYVGWIKNHAI